MQFVRILFAMTGLWLALASAPTAAAPCGGRDQWPTTPAAERAALQRQMDRTPFSRGRFFRVEKGGRVSYVFGTQHTPASGRHALPRDVSKAIRQSRIVYVEMSNRTAQVYSNYMRVNSPYVVDQDGDSGFSRYFTQEEWKALTATAKARKIPPKLMQGLRPWFVYYTLSGPPCTTGRFGIKMDDRVERIARRSRIPSRGLDDPKNVLSLLNSDSPRDYATMLRAALADGPRLLADDLKTADEMYLRGDIQLIQAWTAHVMRKRHGAAVARAYVGHTQDILLTARNRRWMKTLSREFAAGGVFVAVGALHLGGKAGLLTTLSRRGYTITRIDVRR